MDWPRKWNLWRSTQPREWVCAFLPVLNLPVQTEPATDASKFRAPSIDQESIRAKWESATGPTGPPVALAVLLVSAGYYLGSLLGFALTFKPHPVSTLWPTNAILLAALLISHSSLWFFLVLAVFPVHLAVQLQAGVPLMMILCWFISNAGEALLGAVGIRWLVRGSLRFDTFQHVSIFIIVGAFLAPLLSSFVDAGFVVLNKWGDNYWQIWRARLLSNVLAMLTVVPVVVMASQSGVAALRKASPARHVEGLLLAAGIVTVGVLAFGYKGTQPEHLPTLIYAPLPFLLWASLRFGPWALSMSLLITALLAIWSTIHGQGLFTGRAPHENVMSLQIFLIVMTVPLMFLTAIIQERRRLLEATAERNAQLSQANVALRAEIAERKHAQEALQRSEERFIKGFRSSPEAMVISRWADGKIIEVNDRWQTLFGYSRAEGVGHTAEELLHVNETDRQKMRTLVSTYGNIRDLELKLQNKTGDARYAIIVTETVNMSGEPCFLTIFRDITEQKRAQLESQEQRRELTHLTRVAILGELWGALAHELNQPLAAILSNAQAAQHYLTNKKADLAELRDILEDIVDDDKRAGEVIRRLRAMLRKGEKQSQTLGLNELTREALELTHSDCIERNVSVTIRLAPNLPNVIGDRVQLQQVLLNLIVNACDAMSGNDRGDRELTVATVLAENGELQVSVTDCGIGIEHDAKHRLFEPFFTTKEQGLGLGLTISRTIVTEHGGHLWATNNPERGATFTLSLPAKKGL